MLGISHFGFMKIRKQWHSRRKPSRLCCNWYFIQAWQTLWINHMLSVCIIIFHYKLIHGDPSNRSREIISGICRICSFLFWLLLVFGCMWIFLPALNGATSCQPVIHKRCIKSAYLSRDYLTLQDKQLTPYFLTDVHCHRKMMYFYEYFCFP